MTGRLPPPYLRPVVRRPIYLVGSVSSPLPESLFPQGTNNTYRSTSDAEMVNHFCERECKLDEEFKRCLFYLF